MTIPELKTAQITNLYADRSGKVWIAADEGLYRYSVKDHKLEWFDVWESVRQHWVPVDTRDIACFCRDNFNYLHTFDAEKYLLDYNSMDEIENLLDPPLFLPRQPAVHYPY